MRLKRDFMSQWKSLVVPLNPVLKMANWTRLLNSLVQLFAGENVPKLFVQRHHTGSHWCVPTAHLMSIQINDGRPADARHSLKQELSDDGKSVTLSQNIMTQGCFATMVSGICIIFLEIGLEWMFDTTWMDFNYFFGITTNSLFWNGNWSKITTCERGIGSISSTHSK